MDHCFWSHQVSLHKKGKYVVVSWGNTWFVVNWNNPLCPPEHVSSKGTWTGNMQLLLSCVRKLDRRSIFPGFRIEIRCNVAASPSFFREIPNDKWLFNNNFPSNRVEHTQIFKPQQFQSPKISSTKTAVLRQWTAPEVVPELPAWGDEEPTTSSVTTTRGAATTLTGGKFGDAAGWCGVLRIFKLRLGLERR